MPRDFTKWPRLLVVGEPVTPEQAEDILIRTNSWYLLSNDDEWEDYVYRTALIETNDRGFPLQSSLKAFEGRMGVLSNLNFLENSQIASAWVGGPHGWCTWDGVIGTANYNIGKWPAADAVTEDWRRIAEAFPYLRLTAQLVADEGDGPLVGQWDVADGIVTFEPDPQEQIQTPPDDPLSDEEWVAQLYSAHRERGVDPQRLAGALQRIWKDRGHEHERGGTPEDSGGGAGTATPAS